jgi:hypothetical protein
VSEEPKEGAPSPQPPAANEDDRRASAAATNRKRALEEWEENKKRWRRMGVPPALPAAGSMPKK